MDRIEAQAWLDGERSTVNHIPDYPPETWDVRIAQADAARTQQAYWIIRAQEDGLLSPHNLDVTTRG